MAARNPEEDRRTLAHPFDLGWPDYPASVEVMRAALEASQTAASRAAVGPAAVAEFVGALEVVGSARAGLAQSIDRSLEKGCERFLLAHTLRTTCAVLRRYLEILDATTDVIPATALEPVREQRALGQHDLSRFEAALERAEAPAPTIDPEKFRAALDTPGESERLESVLARLQATTPE